MLAIIKEIDVDACLNALQETIDKFIESSHRNTLEAVAEVVVVVNEADGQSLDDKCRQVRAFASPLFLGISLNKCLVDILANQQQRLFLEIAWLLNAISLHAFQSFLTLFVNLLSCLFRCQNTPHLIECIHIEGKIVLPSFEIGDWRIRIAVEFHDAIHKFPYLFIISMEDVGPIFVDIDTFHILAIDIAA